MKKENEIIKQVFVPDGVVIPKFPESIVVANQPTFNEEQETQDFSFTEYKLISQRAYRKPKIEGRLIHNTYKSTND